ncbi:MAG: hypothetical protein CVU59_03130 [Deltaproteobacteria bacterium HGW-Deltaproteobacteria-17]|nr:MAG: hypothetical protein CVU59_03130 [Deltaproteobacteria bacterium HGW-Deltaproteobacteria-17]
MQDFVQWSIDVRRFCRQWHGRLSGYIGRDDFLELFLTEDWNRFEQEFHGHFTASTPRWLSTSLNPAARGAVLTPTVALWDLMQSLRTSIDGQASLAPVEYFVAIVEELKNLSDRLEEDRVRFYSAMQEEVVSIDPEMVEEEASLELDEASDEAPDGAGGDEHETEATARTKNPLATPLDPAALAPRLPSLKKKKKKAPASATYDDALLALDPDQGPILSLAGKKKTAVLPTTPQGAVALPAVALSLYDTILRVARGQERPGEAELVAYCGRRFEELRPAPGEGPGAVLAQLDARIGALSNVDIQQTATASKACDLLSRALFRSWQQLVGDSPTSHLKITLTDPVVRDSHLGEWREFALECTPRHRLPGFARARLEVKIHYVPPQFTIRVKAQGAIALPPPFLQNEAACRIELSAETEALATAWLGQLTALFFRHLALVSTVTES